ncbi:MAG: TRAP transporter small permease [Rhodocyclaceae bacterium]|nr:TRAP transporter small permease [Rhodocyclaceae bacterium]
MRWLDRLVGVLSVACFGLSAALVCLNVFYRYVVLGFLRKAGRDSEWIGTVYDWSDALLSPLTATADELPGLLLVWITFLGAYLAMRRSGHISFDLLVEKLPAPAGRIARSGVAATVIAFLGMVVFEGIRMIRVSGRTEIETAEIAQGWFMAAVPLAAGLMLAASVVALVRAWRASGRAL